MDQKGPEKVDRIFTSRYSNPALQTGECACVGITRYPPRFDLPYELVANLYCLAPTTGMLRVAKRPGGGEQFVRLYRERLDALGVDRVIQLIRAFNDGRDVVLLCFEDLRDGTSRCHRRMLAEWIHERLGLMIDELPDSSPIGSGRRRGAPQATLFDSTEDRLARTPVPQAGDAGLTPAPRTTSTKKGRAKS
jgi:hypothetical protein